MAPGADGAVKRGLEQRNGVTIGGRNVSPFACMAALLKSGLKKPEINLYFGYLHLIPICLF